MPTETDLYVPRNPGDLVTAEDWNDLQKKIQDDIDIKVKKGVEGVTSVKNAESSDKLQDKTPEQLAKEIVDKALAELTKVTGYRNYFKVLKLDEDSVIQHDLNACPLVDMYRLDYFPVVCSEDDQKSFMWTNFYLYHSSEKTLRLTAGAPPVEIQPTKEPYFRIAFSEMLSRYNVQFKEESTFDEVETEFWEAFFQKPNDAFDDDQYCHSPWFDRCCGDRRTVAALKKAGNWDDLWFKMLPCKTINYPVVSGFTRGLESAPPPKTLPVPPQPLPEPVLVPSAAPTNIQVCHYDFNTLGLKLLVEPAPQVPPPVPPEFPEFPAKPELKVMVLLNAGAGIKLEKPTAA
jgi:hypothetical protein